MTANGKKNHHAWVGSLMGFSRPKTVKIWLKLANFDVLLTFTPSDALYRIILGSVRQEIFGIVKKDPYKHKRKKLPPKKKTSREKKSLKNS